MSSPQSPSRPPCLVSSRPPRRVAGLVLVASLLLASAVPAQVPSFDPPVPVDAAARTDTHADEAPRLASGVGGVWVLVWEVVAATDLGLGHDVDLVYARSSDDGAHWSAPKPLSEGFVDDKAEDRQPSIASDGKGTWLVAWTSSRDLQRASKRDRDIHFVVSTDNALTWSEVRPVNSNANDDWGDDESPSVAVDAKGRWVVAWESTDSLANTKGGDRDILFATSTDAGKNWTAPEVIDAAAKTDTDFDTSPRVAVDGAGTWLVAWSTGGPSEERNGFRRGVLVARSEDGAKTWSPPLALAGAGEDDRPDLGPRLAGDGHGNWVCAWSSSDSLSGTIGHDRDILYVRSSDGGRTWSPRAPLNTEAAVDAGDDDTPELAFDSAGNWLAVWVSWDRRGAARGADADLLMAMSRDAGVSWTQPFILNTNAKVDRGEDITPTLATDGSGLWMAAWSTTETFGEVLGLDRDIVVASGRFGFEIAGPPEPAGR